MYRVVIDQSTSGSKLLLFDTTAGIKLIDRLDKGHEQLYPHKGWVEHDPIEIISNVKSLFEQLLAKNKLLKADISSISITNQRESVLLWDSITGQPYTNIMVWQCNRGIKICEELEAKGLNEVIQNKTGLKIDPYFSGSKLKWYFDNHSLSASQVESLMIGTVDTWLIWNLTNKNVFATEVSNASRTLLFDIHSLAWDEQLCDVFNVPITSLPIIKESVDNFGSYQDIPIVSVVADSQSALIGHECKEKYQIKATLGTGSSLLMNNGSSTKASSNKIMTTVAWEEHEETIYAQEGIIRSFGDILNWLKDGIGLYTTFDEASRLAFSDADNGGVYFVPALEGLGAPFWKPGLKAQFVGMTRDTTKAHLVRAGFESMAFQIRAVLDELMLDKEVDIQELKVDGGSTRNDDFMQMLADITKVRVVKSKLEEASAVGTLVILGLTVNEEGVEHFDPINSYEEEYKTWKTYLEAL